MADAALGRSVSSMVHHLLQILPQVHSSWSAWRISQRNPCSTALGCPQTTPQSVCANQTSLLWYSHPMPRSSPSCLSLRMTKSQSSPPTVKALGCHRRVAPSLLCFHKLGPAHRLLESHRLNLLKAPQHWHRQSDNRLGPSAVGMVQMTSAHLRGRQPWSRVTRKVRVRVCYRS